jgi:ABC-type branched-subunit amino acid transport system ATPase component
MLSVKDISTGYGKKQVLFGVSIEVSKGEIVLLAGSNGSGKSTLLKTICGLLPIWNNGHIFFDGNDITGKSTSTLLKNGLLYIPQKNNLFEDLTVKENLEMAGLTLSQKLLQQRIEYVLSIFTSLTPYLKRIPLKLSGGERQLLTLAMATLHQPKMILFDEPFTGLSPKYITFFIEYLELLNENNGITFLIVEHRIRECLQIVNKAFGLKLGNIFSETQIDKDFNINRLNSVFV